MVIIDGSLTSMQVTSFDGLLYCVYTIVIIMESKCIDITFDTQWIDSATSTSLMTW